MIRKLVTLVLPVLLPLAICWAYVAWARYKARLEGRQEPDWREARWGYALLRTDGDLAGTAAPAAAPSSVIERGRFLIAAGDPFGA